MMKKVILLLAFIFSINLSAQETNKTKTTFIRVFDLEGKKIGKGHIYSINESKLVLSKKEKLEEIHLKDIGQIKTKKSGGHNFLIGASSGVLFGTILGTINPPTDSSGGTFTWAGGSSGEELASGLTVGILSGTIVGGISVLFKNSKKYRIDGDLEKWREFVEAISYTTIKRN